MEISITVVVVIVGVLLALKFAKRFSSSIISVILVILGVVGFMYYKSWGPFKNNVADIAHLKNKYCVEEQDADICDCILTPTEQDLRNRFSTAELDSFSVQKIKAAYVLKKSLKATKESSLRCLEEKGAEHKYKEFIQDFVPIENKYLNLAEDKVNDLKGKLKDEFINFKKNKRGIDDKY